MAQIGDHQAAIERLKAEAIRRGRMRFEGTALASVPHLADGGRIITVGTNTAVWTAFPDPSMYSMTTGLSPR